MTETERQIANEQTLDLADSRVTQVESELSRIGRLEAELLAAQERIQTLGAENTKLRDNEGGLDTPKRMSRLRDNAATIDLEQGDARKLQEGIKAAQLRVIALGHTARTSCQGLLWALTETRRANVRAALDAILDFAVIGALGQNLESAAKPVLALKDLGYFFDSYWAASDGMDAQISSLRQLRERFSELRKLCESEPGLTFPAVTVAQPGETLVTAESTAPLVTASV